MQHSCCKIIYLSVVSWLLFKEGSCIARERLAGPHQAGLASYCLSYCGQVGVGGNLAEISGSVPRRARYCKDTCSQPDIEGLKSAKVRTCPASAFAIKEAVGREIDRLEEIGVLERVEFSRWATPIVPVPKSDGTFRLCGDYKATLNAFLEVDQHPLPKPEEIFASLAGGQRFTTLDLSQAYQQLVLDEAAKELVTVSTHQGLYRYTCLYFGVASAPAIF